MLDPVGLLGHQNNVSGLVEIPFGVVRRERHFAGGGGSSIETTNLAMIRGTSAHLVP